MMLAIELLLTPVEIPVSRINLASPPVQQSRCVGDLRPQDEWPPLASPLWVHQTHILDR